MRVGPTMLMPMSPVIWGAPASANSSLRMSCSTSVRPAPPYSFGHEGATQPRSVSFRRHSAGAPLQAAARLDAAAGELALEDLARLAAQLGGQLVLEELAHLGAKAGFLHRVAQPHRVLLSLRGQPARAALQFAGLAALKRSKVAGARARRASASVKTAPVQLCGVWRARRMTAST